MTEADRINLTAIVAPGPVTRRHHELYEWFLKRQHRVRPGSGLDLPTLLMVHFLAEMGAGPAVEVGEEVNRPPKAEKPRGKHNKPLRPAAVKPEEIADDEPEPPEGSYEEAEAAVDFKSLRKGSKVWVLGPEGTLDGEYVGPGRNGKVYVKIAGRKESIDPEAVRIATA